VGVGMGGGDCARQPAHRKKPPGRGDTQTGAPRHGRPAVMFSTRRATSRSIPRRRSQSVRRKSKGQVHGPSPGVERAEVVMQVVILCGGQGTRIRDVAEDIPKPMSAIGGRPILWHIMNGFAPHGFTDFILCLGYKGWVIKQYFLDYHLANSDLCLVLGCPADVQILHPTREENWKVLLAETGLDVMTGCRVKRIEKYVTGDHFLLTYGDGVADVNLRQLVAFHVGHGKTGTVTAVRPPGRFGEIEFDGSRVLDFNEKPLL